MPSVTDPTPSEDSPALTTDGPPAAEHVSNTSAFARTNPFLDRWLKVVASDGSLPTEAHEVASVMARSVGIGQVAFTDWQRINAALGRGRRDLGVFETMSELALEGYLDRDADDQFVYGWLLRIPEEEQ